MSDPVPTPESEETPQQAWTRIIQACMKEAETSTDLGKTFREHSEQWTDFCKARGIDLVVGVDRGIEVGVDRGIEAGVV